MATKTEVVLVDDLTGDPADTTVKFALDKTEYEIDLTKDNATELREALSRYVNAARRVSGGGRRAAVTGKAFEDVDGRAVRAWAQSKGIQVSPRGRLSKDVVEQYRAAGN